MDDHKEQLVLDSPNLNFSSPQTSTRSEQTEYQTSGYRYVILFFFSCLTVTISSIQTSLVPAATYIAAAYDINVIAVTLSAIIFCVTYIPMTFVAIYWFQHMRPSVVFRIACVNAVAGGWLRTISLETSTFNVILVGFTVISLSYPVMLSSVTLICNAWLSDKERTMWI